MQVDALADEIIVVAYRPDLDPGDKRVITENLRWLLSKMAPTRFGERLLVAGDASNPIQILHRAVAPTLADLSDDALDALESFCNRMVEHDPAVGATQYQRFGTATNAPGEAAVKGFGGGGFLGLSNTFRAMTAAPAIEHAVNLAHRAARQRLEAGGSIGSTRKPTKVRPDATEFIVPSDVNAVALARAIRAKLGDGETDDDLYPLERKLGGRVVLRGRHILRLGDGRFDKGRAFLHGLATDLRRREWRKRFAAE